ncbi:MAG: membrane protein [Bacteroidia bacterium]|nr:MAG: membrane protein [Bacteroidia bacterium]
MFSNRLYILFALGIGVMSLFSQQKYTISGKVFDASTKEPLPFVPLIIKGTTIGTQTDFDGNFTLKTDKIGDSLIAVYVGYKRTARPIQKGVFQQVINMPMELEGIALEEVVVKAGENPAHRIIRNAIANRARNNPNKLEAYQYEVYNKIEFDLNKIPKEMRESKLMKPVAFVFKNVDSVYSDEKPSLPFFMVENISEFYYKKNPTRRKEIVKASKITGVENSSISSIMGDMYQKLNIYDNNVLIFDKQIPSPISSEGFFYYKYFLEDSGFIGNKYCYHIRFKPKRTGDVVFTGNIWIADTSWAVKRFEMSLPKEANINFINSVKATQEFDLIDTTWMMVKDRLVIDFSPTKNSIGFYGRKTTSYKKFVLNQPKPDEFYTLGDAIVVEDDALHKDETFWQQNRHDTLSQRELKIFKMIDTIQTLPVYRTWVDFFYLLFNGYKKLNNFEIGPYYNMISYNLIEGPRFRFGGRTSAIFSKWYELDGYVAYGTKDEKWKYGLGFKCFITQKPHRQLFGLFFKSDYEILGQSSNGFSQDNLFASFLRSRGLRTLTKVNRTEGWYEREWFPGLTTRITLFGTTYTPLPLNDPYLYKSSIDDKIKQKEFIKNVEVRLNVRFAYKEKFVGGNFERVSLGTTYPIIQLMYSKSLPDAYGGEYNFQRVAVSISKRLRITPILGYTDVNITAGKIFGVLPYPLMELHGGNETYMYDPYAYNMMRYFEFASDQYVSGSAEHHFNGLFLNRIPLLKKLKFREVAGIKGVWGSINDANRNVLIFPSSLKALDKGPYLEANVGIENIFKIFRIDALWRLTYPLPRAIDNFGFKFSFQLIL